jgi:hypothetical protein
MDDTEFSVEWIAERIPAMKRSINKASQTAKQTAYGAQLQFSGPMEV